MDPTVTGALLALSGVVVTGVASEWRASGREKAAVAREIDRESREKTLRTFNERRDAHVAFSELVGRWRNSALNYEMQHGSLPDTDYDTFDEVFDALAVVQLYASMGAHDAAEKAAAALVHWINSPSKENRSRFDALEEARGAYVAAVRKDLDIE